MSNVDYFYSDLVSAGVAGNLSPEDAEQLFMVVKPTLRSFRAGDKVCTEGEAASSLFLARGRDFNITKLADGNDVHINTRKAPCIIGEVAFLMGEPRRTATVSTTGPLEVWEIDFSLLKSTQPSDIISRFNRNISALVARKFNEVTGARAQETAFTNVKLSLLHQFVNEFALTSQGEVSEEYVEHEVIVFFSDIVGFSRIAESLTPRETGSFINAVLSPQTHHIENSEGHVDKFIGDAVMAFWVVKPGDCKSKSNIASKAVKAVQSALNEVMSIPVPKDNTMHAKLRIGMHIGRVAVGNFGTESRTSFTLIGDTVNYAARLEQVHDSDNKTYGPIRISSDLFNALATSLQSDFPEQGHAEVKGKELDFHYSTDT